MLTKNEIFHLTIIIIGFNCNCSFFFKLIPKRIPIRKSVRVSTTGRYVRRPAETKPLYRTDTSVKRTSRVGPCLSLLLIL